MIIIFMTDHYFIQSLYSTCMQGRNHRALATAEATGNAGASLTTPTSINGATSPAARATARIRPVIIAGLAIGSTVRAVNVVLPEGVELAADDEAAQREPHVDGLLDRQPEDGGAASAALRAGERLRLEEHDLAAPLGQRLGGCVLGILRRFHRGLSLRNPRVGTLRLGPRGFGGSGSLAAAKQHAAGCCSVCCSPPAMWCLPWWAACSWASSGRR